VCRSYLLLKLHAAEIALHYLDAYSLSNDWLIAADHFMKPHDAILRRLLFVFGAAGWIGLHQLVKLALRCAAARCWAALCRRGVSFSSAILGT
jgi:hypothetical protein